MLGVTHATSGAAVWLAGCAAAPLVGAHPDIVTVGVGAAVCAAGSLLPDYDHPRSIASNLLPPVTNIVAWLTRLLSRAVYRATATRADLNERSEGTHRALTHTVVWATFVGVTAWLALTLAAHRWPFLAGWAWLGLPLGVGCLVHVLGDACTRSGVPLLWPLAVGGERWRRFGAPIRFTTGRFGEKVAMVVFMAVGLGALWLLIPSLTAGLPVATP